jgi:hypothetical protein
MCQVVNLSIYDMWTIYLYVSCGQFIYLCILDKLSIHVMWKIYLSTSCGQFFIFICQMDNFLFNCTVGKFLQICNDDSDDEADEFLEMVLGGAMMG